MIILLPWDPTEPRDVSANFQRRPEVQIPSQMAKIGPLFTLSATITYGTSLGPSAVTQRNLRGRCKLQPSCYGIQWSAAKRTQGVNVAHRSAEVEKIEILLYTYANIFIQSASGSDVTPTCYLKKCPFFLLRPVGIPTCTCANVDSSTSQLRL